MIRQYDLIRCQFYFNGLYVIVASLIVYIFFNHQFTELTLYSGLLICAGVIARWLIEVSQQVSSTLAGKHEWQTRFAALILILPGIISALGILKLQDGYHDLPWNFLPTPYLFGAATYKYVFIYGQRQK